MNQYDDRRQEGGYGSNRYAQGYGQESGRNTASNGRNTGQNSGSDQQEYAAGYYPHRSSNQNAGTQAGGYRETGGERGAYGFGDDPDQYSGRSAFNPGYGASSGYGGYEQPRQQGYGAGGYRGEQYGAYPNMRGRGPKNYNRSDERIAEDINDQLADDALIDAGNIEVEVRNATVTLSGSVTGRWARHRAEDIAADASGVKHVDNRLRVQPQDAQDSQNSQNGGHAYGSGSSSYASDAGSRASAATGTGTGTSAGTSTGMGTATGTGTGTSQRTSGESGGPGI